MTSTTLPPSLHPRATEWPVVSVIITSYDYGRFLTDAIESVLGQNYPRLEVVVVDDGSTDTTHDVVARYARDGVGYIYQHNQGVAAARNRGLSATTGPLVAFCDGDDAWGVDKLTRQLAHLRDHPEVGLVTSHAYACDEGLHPRSVVHAGRGASEQVFEALLVRNIVLNPTCVVVRREILDAVGGFSLLPRWEDWDTWLRVAQRTRVGFVDDALAYVRRHDASLSPTDGQRRFELDEGILERHIAAVPDPRTRRRIRRRARSNAYFHAATTVAERGNRAAARRCAVRALVLDPRLLLFRKIGLVVRTCVPARAFEALRRAVGKRRWR